MQTKMIEETLEKILEIDAKAVKVEKDALQNEKDMEDDLRKKKKDLEFSIMKEARKEAKAAYDQILSQAKKEVEDIERVGKKECEHLNHLLDERKDEMVEKVFIRLFEDVISQSRRLD